MNNNYININNTINTDHKENSFGLLLLVLIVIFILFVSIMLLASESSKINKDYSSTNETYDSIVDYDNILNYEFTMLLDFVEDTNIIIDAVGFYDKSNNMEEFTFIYNSKAYNVKTNYKTKEVFIFNDEGSLIKRTKTNANFTLNIENLIYKIKNNNSDVVDLGDGHYSIKINTNFYPDDIYADVYVKDGFILKVKYDLTNLLKDEGYKKYVVIFELYNYNKNI